MLKPDSLRRALTDAVTVLKTSPEMLRIFVDTGCAKAPGHMQITKSLRIPDVVISTWLVVSSRSWEQNLQSPSE